MTNKKDDKIVFAFLSVFLLVIGYIIAVVTKNNDAYVNHYAKQGIILTVGFVIAGIIPILGWIFGILVFILWIFSWAYALSGKKKDVWLISNLSSKFSL